MSFVEFAYGSTNVAETELVKLTKLSKALNDRPALNVEIEGAVDRAQDRKALATRKWQEELKVRRLQELTRLTNAPISSDLIVIETNDYRRLLRVAFIERFGTNIADILRTNALDVQAQAASAAGAGASSRASAQQRTKHGLFGLLGRKNAPKTPEQKAQQALEKSLAAEKKGGLFGLFSSRSKEPSAGKGGTSPAAVPKLTLTDAAVLVRAPDEVMESMLIERMEIPEQALRSLMTARAQWVQNYLIGTGQVAPERILLDAAAKTLNSAYKDQNRAVLTLN
jgi:hypothetical protein